MKAMGTDFSLPVGDGEWGMLSRENCVGIMAKDMEKTRQPWWSLKDQHWAGFMMTLLRSVVANHDKSLV